MTLQGSPNWRGQANVSQQPERREQSQQFQKKGGVCNGSVNGGRAARTSPWIQTQQQVKCQQQNGSGRRMFFLGSDSGSTESCGTGVFLPRGIWYSSESRKKPGTIICIRYFASFLWVLARNSFHLLGIFPLGTIAVGNNWSWGGILTDINYPIISDSVLFWNF